MAWDHPRALDPLAAVSAEWSRASGVPVRWEARPLKAFEDQPLEELASTYDLVLMDYPFVGTAAASGLISPVDDWADHAWLGDQARNSVGPSYASYTWLGKQWALAIDAAAQVSAVRPDLLAAAGLTAVPHDWSAVAELADHLRHAPARVALPLNPNHAYCAFLSLGVASRGREFWREGARFDVEAAQSALEFLRHLAPALHPISRSADPIAVSDRMADSDEILFVPLMFGYSNYARTGFRKRILRFGNAPRGYGKSGGHIGSVLGGVGIAVSAQSRQASAAASLARALGSPEVQAGLYVTSGGQPGHAAAWRSTEANRLTGNFFSNTLETMQHAFLRPRVPGHRRFQEEAGLIIHRAIWEPGSGMQRCLEELRARAEHLLGDWENEGAPP